MPEHQDRSAPASTNRTRDSWRLIRHIVAIFLQGLVGLLPLIVTVVILGWLGLAIERILGAALLYVIPASWYVAGMGLAIGMVFIFMFGILINQQDVPRLIHAAEGVIGRVPLVKTIYGAVRDLLSFFSGSGREGTVNQVVVVTFGDTGIRAVGLLMRDTFEDLPEGLGGEDYIVVYFPQSYQLGGMLLLVPRENVHPLDMNLEDALRFVITAGAKTTGTPKESVDADPLSPNNIPPVDAVPTS